MPLLVLFCENCVEKIKPWAFGAKYFVQVQQEIPSHWKHTKAPTVFVLYFIVPYGLPVFCTIQHQFSV